MLCWGGTFSHFTASISSIYCQLHEAYHCASISHQRTETERELVNPMRGWAHCHGQGLRVGKAQWEGQGGWSEREKGNEQPTSKGNTASGPSGRGCPPQPHTPAVGAVLRGAHFSHSPLGVLLLTAHESLLPTSPACTRTPPPPTPLAGSRTPQDIFCCPVTSMTLSLPSLAPQTKRGKALRRAGIVNATSIL